MGIRPVATEIVRNRDRLGSMDAMFSGRVGCQHTAYTPSRSPNKWCLSLFVSICFYLFKNWGMASVVGDAGVCYSGGGVAVVIGPRFIMSPGEKGVADVGHNH